MNLGWLFLISCIKKKLPHQYLVAKLALMVYSVVTN